MENKEKEVINKEALLNKALEPEFSDYDRYRTLTKVAQDYLRDKLYYLGCAKVYEEAGINELADEYRRRAKQIDRTYLEPLSKIVGVVKLYTWDIDAENKKEIRKYFGDRYFQRKV